MKRIVLLLLAAIAAMADEDPWAKVLELKSGSELRIYKVNTKDSLLAKLDRAGEESLIVITRQGQVSIPKDDIERIDCRRADARRVLKETRAERKVAPRGSEISQNTIPGATTSVKTGFEIPSRSAFEQIYTRTPSQP